MKSTPNRFVGVIPSCLLVLGLLLLAPAINAQRNPAPPPAPIRPAEEMRPAPLSERQFIMMEMERRAAEPRTEEQQRLALAQIAQDYREIQVVNNKMMSVSIPSAAPNFMTIAKSLEEIRKRAGRLKENLRLAESKGKSPTKTKYKQVETTAELKSQLLILDESIMRLVKNPIFKNPDVVDVNEAAKARGELEFIIVTSQLIGKDADRLNKSAEKTQ
ncbi:MAG TPA: hypothetical protein VIT88_01885 [Pyrinomonadaceae bacterium]